MVASLDASKVPTRPNLVVSSVEPLQASFLGIKSTKKKHHQLLNLYVSLKQGLVRCQLDLPWAVHDAIPVS
jgi:hypothetical protein